MTTSVKNLQINVTVYVPSRFFNWKRFSYTYIRVHIMSVCSIIHLTSIKKPKVHVNGVTHTYGRMYIAKKNNEMF